MEAGTGWPLAGPGPAAAPLASQQVTKSMECNICGRASVSYLDEDLLTPNQMQGGEELEICLIIEIAKGGGGTNSDIGS
jgi:hypothetical protein